MALFIPGMRCPLCGTSMTKSSDIITFSSFVADRADALFVFSDAAIHRACFARHPLSQQATEWQEITMRNSGPGKRSCAVCETQILDPNDYFGTGLLSRDPTSPLHEFNFVHLHRSHADQWTRFDVFRRLLEEVDTAGVWQGPRLTVNPSSLGIRWVPR